jgi:hypothetical protein
MADYDGTVTDVDAMEAELAANEATLQNGGPPPQLLRTNSIATISDLHQLLQKIAPRHGKDWQRWASLTPTIPSPLTTLA